MVTSSIEQRIARLERKAHWYGVVILLQFFVFAVFVFSPSTDRAQAQSSAKSIRTRSLIIEDEQGRARILMGAPFPRVQERSRQDSPTEAIVFLDDSGHDRLTLGRAPDPQVGGKILHRIAPSFGVLIHDDHGDERGSYGWLSNGRALITLDRPGAEAWAAVVNDHTGQANMLFNFPSNVVEDTAALELGTKGPDTFLRFNTTKGTDRAVFSTINGGKPSFKIFDDAGNAKGDLLGTTDVLH